MANIPDLTVRRKRNDLFRKITGLLVALIVTGVAVTAYAVSQKLNSNTALAPNAAKGSFAATDEITSGAAEAKVWHRLPPTSGYKVTQYTVQYPDTNSPWTLRTVYLSGEDYWESAYQFNIGSTVAVRQGKISELLNSNIPFSQEVPKSNFDAFYVTQIGSDLFRYSFYKGDKYYFYNFSSGDKVTLPINKIYSRVGVSQINNNLSYIDIDTGETIPLPSSNIDATTAFMITPTTLRNYTYKGNRYWVIDVNLPNATSNPPSMDGLSIVPNSTKTRNLAKEFVSIPDPNGVWSSSPLATQADVNSNNYFVNGVTFYYQSPGAVRVNVFRGDRYYGYVCDSAGCSARATMTLTDSLAQIKIPYSGNFQKPCSVINGTEIESNNSITLAGSYCDITENKEITATMDADGTSGDVYKIYPRTGTALTIKMTKLDGSEIASLTKQPMALYYVSGKSLVALSDKSTQVLNYNVTAWAPYYLWIAPGILPPNTPYKLKITFN